MSTEQGISLKAYNSFGIRAFAAGMYRLDEFPDVERLQKTKFVAGKDLVLGGGSNILFASDVPGTVFLNRLKGCEILENHDDQVLLDVAAGEDWHRFVRWTLEQGFYGLENLSLIPGRAGAAPMQNIGAYGVEISQCLDSVQAWDWHKMQTVQIEKEDCGLSYRDSRFKTTEADRFLILSCRLRLHKNFQPRLSYAGIVEELKSMGIDRANAKQVSDAVIRIRRRKLPDPARIGNAGSFFKNPEIDPAHAEQLRTQFDGLPVYPIDENTSKLSAAWLIEQCGWKGFRDGDAGVSDQHALVLINHGEASGSQLLALSRNIANTVKNEFGIVLEQEPRIVEHLF